MVWFNNSGAVTPFRTFGGNADVVSRCHSDAQYLRSSDCDTCNDIGPVSTVEVGVLNICLDAGVDAFTLS